MNRAFLQPACSYLICLLFWRWEAGVPLLLVGTFGRSHFHILQLGQVFCAALLNKRRGTDLHKALWCCAGLQSK